MKTSKVALRTEAGSLRALLCLHSRCADSSVQLEGEGVCMHVCAFVCGQRIAMHELCSNAPVPESFCHVQVFFSQTRSKSYRSVQAEKEGVFFNVHSFVFRRRSTENC